MNNETTRVRDRHRSRIESALLEQHINMCKLHVWTYVEKATGDTKLADALSYKMSLGSEVSEFEQKDINVLLPIFTRYYMLKNAAAAERMKRFKSAAMHVNSLTELIEQRNDNRKRATQGL